MNRPVKELVICIVFYALIVLALTALVVWGFQALFIRCAAIGITDVYVCLTMFG